MPALKKRVDKLPVITPVGTGNLAIVLKHSSRRLVFFRYSFSFLFDFLRLFPFFFLFRL